MKPAVLAAGIIAFAPFLQAQSPGVKSQPIQVESSEVEIDVTVTAKKGASTDGLTAQDFSVREDGKLQTINSVESTRPAASLTHLVVYLDLYSSNMQPDDLKALQEAIEGFINSVAAPDLYISVMRMTRDEGPRVLQQFTTFLIPLLAAAGIPWPPHYPSVGVHSLGDSTAAACRSMARAPGDKALLMVGNFNPPPALIHAVDPPTSRAIDACNDANVRVYSVVVPLIRHVYGGWTIPGMGPAPTPGNFKMLGDPHSVLAEQTGGLAFNITPALKDQLTAIVSEPDHYYRLFYTPPASKDGACHKLRVEMTRPGLSARAKQGYCTVRRIESEMGGDISTLQGSMQLPYFYVAPDRATVRVAAEFDPSGIAFGAEKKGAVHRKIDIDGTALLPDGRAAARFTDSIEAGQFKSTPYRYAHPFYVPPGRYTFRLDVRMGANAIGRLEEPLDVEPWNPGALAMGSLALTTEAAPAPQFAEAPSLEGQGPLVADGKELHPAARNVLERSGQAYFYTEFYVPESSDPAGLKMEYCILDPRTGSTAGCSYEVSLRSLVRPGDPVIRFGTQLPVDKLPAGDYRLEVRASIPASQETATRAIDFEVR